MMIDAIIGGTAVDGSKGEAVGSRYPTMQSCKRKPTG